MSGKGSKPRPYSIPLDAYGNEYERIFRPVRPANRGAQTACGEQPAKPAINGRRRLYTKGKRA